MKSLIKGQNLDTELQDYRLISNLSFLSKIIEKAVQSQLQKYFDHQLLLSKHQGAYKQDYSLETTLLNMCDNILNNMEKQKCTSIVCLDLSTVFDTVNHRILVDVLKSCFGITEQALAWISSHLSNRKFLVQVSQLTSKIVKIDFSVPQSSILGPILFNCYASTLMEIIPESKDSFLSGYADDHAIIHSLNPEDNNIKQKIENDIGKIKIWMGENHLKMNNAKTEFIILGTTNNLRKNTLDNIKIGYTKIHQTSKIKFLGVHLDEKLSLRDPVRIDKKAIYNLMLIHNIHKYFNIDTAKMLLFTLVLSQLDYVNSILSRAPTTTVKPYKTTQNFAARVAYKK